jgi:hypothetical protein
LDIALCRFWCHFYLEGTASAVQPSSLIGQTSRPLASMRASAVRPRSGVHVRYPRGSSARNEPAAGACVTRPDGRAGESSPASSFIDRGIIHAEFPPQIPIPLWVHHPSILQELPQALQSGLGEERRLPTHRVRPDPHQSAATSAICNVLMTTMRAASRTEADVTLLNIHHSTVI